MADKPGTDVVPFEKYAVAQFDQESLSEALTANLGGGDVNLDRDLDRVKIPGSGGTTWTVPTLEGEEDTKTLSGIIVAWKNVRAYYATSYEESPNSPPTCASDDAVTGTGFPYHKGSDAPEGDPITLPCAQCPNSQWGSTDKGDSNAQACQQQRLLFLLTEGDMLPIIVKLPPTSIKGCADYFLRLTRAGKPFFAVQTSITLEKQAGPPAFSIAKFAKTADLAPDEITVVRQYKNALTPAVQRVSGVEAAEPPATAAA